MAPYDIWSGDPASECSQNHYVPGTAEPDSHNMEKANSCIGPRRELAAWVRENKERSFRGNLRPLTRKLNIFLVVMFSREERNEKKGLDSYRRKVCLFIKYRRSSDFLLEGRLHSLIHLHKMLGGPIWRRHGISLS